MRKTQPAMVGLFVIGAAIIAIVGVLTFGGSRWLEPSTRAVLFFEESVGGLSAGSGVNFRGVRIGEVERVRLEIDPETANAMLPVYIRLTPGDIFGELSPDDLEDELLVWVEKGLSGQLQSNNLLTGQLSISLDFREGADGTGRMRDRPTGGLQQIPVVPSQVEQFREAITEVDWRNMVGLVEETLMSVTALTDMLQTELVGTGESIERTAIAAEALVEDVQVALETLSLSTQETLATYTELGQDARAMLSQLEGQVSTTLTNFDDLAISTDNRLGDASEDMARVLAQTESTLANINAVSQQLSTLTHPRSPERDDLQRTLRNMAAATATLSRFATIIENNPNSLFFGSIEE